MARMRTMTRAELEPVIQTALRGGQRIINDEMQVAALTGITNLLEVGVANATIMSRGLAQALRKDAINREILKRTNSRLAAQARSDTIRAYRTRTPRRNTPQYRTRGRHYGLVGAALADAGHEAQSTAFKVQPFDIELLDRLTRVGSQGALWRQLNYGALPAAGKGPKAFAVVFEGGAALQLQMPNHPIAAGVLKRPRRGYWRDAGGKTVPNRETGTGSNDQFWPGRKSSGDTVALRGSRATQFMDAAAASLARNMGPAYAKMYKEIIKDGSKRARLERRGVEVPLRPASARAPRYIAVKIREG